MPARPAKVSGSAPMRHAEPGDLRQAAGDQRRPRVVAQPEAVEDAGGDRDHVLERPAQLDPDHVGIGVDPEARRREDRLHRLGHGRDRASRHHRGGLVLVHLAREAGSREHRQPGLRQFARDHVRHQRQRIRLEALGGAHHEGARSRTASRTRRSTARTA